MKVDQMNEEMFTLGMWVAEKGKFIKGDEIEVTCKTICPELLTDIIHEGTGFELWDSGVFAKGVVTKRFNDW